jgi:hypothetical protein
MMLVLDDAYCKPNSQYLIPNSQLLLPFSRQNNANGMQHDLEIQ